MNPPEPFDRTGRERYFPDVDIERNILDHGAVFIQENGTGTARTMIDCYGQDVSRIGKAISSGITVP
jgi:hypothetical protein